MDSGNSFHLEISQLSKSFGSNRVLKDVDIAIRPGEFIGLMGPNGAGKSTLIKILAGVHTATSGQIRLDGKVVASLADRQEVGFIHQDLGLVDGLTIAENLGLGTRPKRRLGMLLDKRAEAEDAKRALRRVGLKMSPDTPLSDLTPGEKTLVAVARVFDRGARILVVDETTSTLPLPDANRVISSLRDAAAQGATVIMVTHKLSEILDSTTRVLVLLDGDLVSDAPTEGLDRAMLVDMLRQSETSADLAVLASGGPTTTLMSLHGVHVGDVGPINLDLSAGQIVGISGLPGSGLHDVALAVAGMAQVTEGTIKLSRPGLRRALVPPHRESQGGFGALSVRENMSIGGMKRWRVLRSLIDGRQERRECEAAMAELAVKPNSLDVPFDVLSGGNKQKVIFARALLRQPDIYVLSEPTRGVDVGTRSEIYRLIRKLAANGAAIFVASSDAEDLFSVCQQVALITNKTLGSFRNVSDLTAAELEAMV